MNDRNKSQPQGIKETLKEILEDAQNRSGNIFTTITKVWNETTEEKIKKHAKLDRLHHSTLFFVVDKATWVYEIERKHKKKILKHIQEKVGIETVKKLVFKVG
ncbi:DciA family protein [Candidatus Omnitrophota bacterium]